VNPTSASEPSSNSAETAQPGIIDENQNSNSNDNSDSSSGDLISNSNSDSSGSDTGSSKSFGEKHTTKCVLGPTILGGIGHTFLGAGLRALCSSK